MPGDVAAAEEALAQDKPRRAIELLGELAQSDDPRANAVLARAYYALRDYPSAVEPFLIASDAAPDDKVLAREATMACWGAARVPGTQFPRAFLADALRMAKRAGEGALLAPLHREAGNFEQALVAYRKLTDTPKVRQAIADCFAGLGKDDEARKAYIAALELAMSTRDLAIAYRSAFAAQRGGQLVQWLTKELQKKPDDPWLRLYRGYARVRLQLDAGAVEDLRIATKGFPDLVRAKVYLCQSLIRFGLREQHAESLEEGEVVARELTRLGDPSGKTQLFWLASNAWINRNVERSCRLLKELWALDETDKNIGLNYAAMARRLNRYDESERVYIQLLESYEDDPDVLNDLGILRDGRGDRAGAVEAWKRVLAEDREDMNALENLFTDAWERGDKVPSNHYLRRGMAVAESLGGTLLVRWRWFADRLAWAPAGHGDR